MADHKTQLEEFIRIVRGEAASDLHLSIGRHPTIRVAGTLISLVRFEPLSGNDTLEFLNAMLTKEQKETFLREKEVDFSYSFGETIRFRGNAFIQRGGVGIALRYIPREIPSLAELH